jgi:hypothetical protein
MAFLAVRGMVGAALDQLQRPGGLSELAERQGEYGHGDPVEPVGSGLECADINDTY